MNAVPQHLSGIQLSIGAVHSGWYSIDNRGGNDADCVWDLEQTPWPLPDACAIRAYAGHVVNRINPARWGLILFFNEVWRILKTGGELLVVSYYGTNSRYAADPAACCSLTEASFYYFDPAHKAGLWQVYQPAPWQILSLSWAADGNLEAVLGKR